MIDALETEFKKERNVTYVTNQLLSRKQFINESLEQFHSVLSGLAARCNFGTLEDRILKDVFIVNMNNREAQKELCRSTKTPEEVYRIALVREGKQVCFILCCHGISGGPRIDIRRRRRDPDKIGTSRNNPWRLSEQSCKGPGLLPRARIESR